MGNRVSPTRRRLLLGLASAPALAAWPLAGAAGQAVTYLRPGEAGYEQRRALFNRRITTRPAVIAACTAEDGVQAAVRTARDAGLPIAIRSGGHSFEGFSSGPGLVVDVSAMSALALDGERLSVQPGCTLEQLYAQLLPRGRLLPAGSCGGVAIAGLALGGGYGFFTRRYGLTCDSLTRVRLVDGAGAIRDSVDDPDLLWACRGAGNAGLGIVTQLDFDTYPAPTTFRSFRFRAKWLTPAQSREHAAQWFELAAGLPPDAFSAWILNGRTLTVLATSFNENPTEPAFAVMLTALRSRGYRELPPRSGTPLESVKQFYGKRGALHFKNASAGFYRSFADLSAVAERVFERVAEAPGMLLQINTFQGSPTLPAPAAAFPHRGLPFLGELQCYWEEPQDEPAALRAIAAAQRLLADSGIRAHYSSYPDLDLPDPLDAYYGASNLVRLTAIKRRYDPDNRIRHAQSLPG